MNKVIKEFETKYLSEKNKFKQLYSLLLNYGKPVSFVQTNYYFDTKELDYYNTKITVRIREKPNSIKLTIKDKREYLKDKPLSFEHSCNLSPNEFKEIILQENIELNKYFNVSNLNLPMQLELLGDLTTNRTQILIKNVLFCFDINKYCNYEDFEIEAEANIDRLEKIDDWFEKKGLKRSFKGKYSRFISALEKSF